MSKNNQDDSYPTRPSLLIRLKDWDDQESWRVFFKTYGKLIYSAATKAGLSDAEAKDVVQETVVTVCKKIKDLKYDPAVGSFRGWLLNTTRWKISDEFRRRKPSNGERSPSLDESIKTGMAESIPDPASFNLDSVWEEEWQKNLMDAAIERVKQKVDPRHYQVFDLYAIKGRPAHEVASTLGISSAQVHLIKHRIIALVKKEIEQLEKSPI